MIELKIVSKDGEIKFSEKGTSIDCVYNGEYQPGDKIVIGKKDMDFIALQLDKTLAESIVYAPTSTIEFEIPYGELKRGYDNEAFAGTSHHIKVSEPDDEKAFGTRNIALNSHDKRGKSKIFPQKYSHTSSTIRDASEPYTKEYRADIPISQENTADATTSASAHSRSLPTIGPNRARSFGVPSRYRASTNSMTKQNNSR